VCYRNSDYARAWPFETLLSNYTLHIVLFSYNQTSWLLFQCVNVRSETLGVWFFKCNAQYKSTFYFTVLYLCYNAQRQSLRVELYCVIQHCKCWILAPPSSTRSLPTTAGVTPTDVYTASQSHPRHERSTHRVALPCSILADVITIVTIQTCIGDGTVINTVSCFTRNLDDR